MFEDGTKVVCINGKFSDEVKKVYSALPVQDKVYVIRDAVPGMIIGSGERTVTVYLVGLINPCSPKGYEYGFNPSRFRPLDEIKQELKKRSTKKKSREKVR